MVVDQNKRFSIFSRKGIIIRHNTKNPDLRHERPSITLLSAPITLLSGSLIILLVHLVNSQQQDLF